MARLPSRNDPRLPVKRPGGLPEHDNEIERYLEQVQPVLREGVLALNRSTTLCNQILPTLEKLWRRFRRELNRPRQNGDLSDKQRSELKKDLAMVTRMLERLARASAYVSKIADDQSRLRAFLEGGPDQRAQLDFHVVTDGKGETELMELVIQAAAETGRLCPQCTERARAGVAKVIEVRT